MNLDFNHLWSPHVAPEFVFQKFLSLNFFLGGFVLGTLLVLLALWGLPKIGLLDFPERYGLKRKKVPYPGGLIVLLGSLFLLWFDIRFLPLVVGGLVLGAISFWDDRHQVSAKIRLGVHMLVAALVWWLGVQINYVGDPFNGTNFHLGQWPIISFGVTVIWFVALQNAMNWFDGIKGLALGVSGVGFCTLGLLGLIRPELFFDIDHSSFTFAHFYLSGLCFGGLWLYLNGKILLGDTGSQVLGFLLAGMSIISGAKIATTVLVLGLPLLDFVLVIGRRMLIEKKSPFKGDLLHIHHRLAKIVEEKKASIYLIWVSVALGLIGVLSSGQTKLIALGIAGIVILSLYGWIIKSASSSGISKQ